MADQRTESEEVALNTKRLMEQSVPFHEQSSLLRNIHWQWRSGKVLTNRQKKAFLTEVNRLQFAATKHKAACKCGRHNTIYVTVRLLQDVRIFEGTDCVRYSLLKGNVARIPLSSAIVLVMRRYADVEIATALDMSHEVYHHV